MKHMERGFTHAHSEPAPVTTTTISTWSGKVTPADSAVYGYIQHKNNFKELSLICLSCLHGYLIN